MMLHDASNFQQPKLQYPIIISHYIPIIDSNHRCLISPFVGGGYVGQLPWLNPLLGQVTVRGRHVTPLEADTCDDADFKEAGHGATRKNAGVFVMLRVGKLWTRCGLFGFI